MEQRLNEYWKLHFWELKSIQINTDFSYRIHLKEIVEKYWNNTKSEEK